MFTKAKLCVVSGKGKENQNRVQCPHFLSSVGQNVKFSTYFP